MKNNVLDIHFDSIREELDEHLDSINTNTSEIQGAFEYIAEVEGKVDKISEKLDRVLQFLDQMHREQKQPVVEPLTLREQEVFLAMYASKGFLSYDQIARKIELPENIVHTLIDAIITKGVPIIKKHEGMRVHVQLDDQFKQLQTKENILQINEAVMQSMSTLLSDESKSDTSGGNTPSAFELLSSR